MNQTERRTFLISRLLKENARYAGMEIPSDVEGQKRLLRSLMNVRPAREISPNFLEVQDAYLREAIRERESNFFGICRP